MRLLLINPKAPESFWNFRWAVERILPGKRAVNPPLGLATLAALTPSHWQVEIVDENIESVPLAPAADVIGVGGMGVQFGRQRQLLAYYRSRGYPVVAGGSYASLCPERYAGIADSVVCGEAEYIWPRFCADFEHGSAAPLYRETGTVDLADSPVPRFDLLKLGHYTTATLQFSRGCPYLCEFCDIIVMFGRKPRHKRIEQVELELDRLRALGVSNVFFVDDNLIGNRGVAKALLRRLRDYQARHGRPFSFGTEVSLNLAQDRELMQLFRESGFGWVFIGIESPDPASLRETRKLQNVHENPLTAVRRIHAHGIDVLAGFIIGFDNDTEQTFERQHRFIMRSGITCAMIGLLNALPRTPLYARLAREGRLREQGEESDNTKLATNVVPRRMGYEAMVAGYKRLYERLLTDAAIAQRVIRKLRHLRDPVYRGEYPPAQRLLILWRLLLRGILPGGAVRVYHFMRSLPWRAPGCLPLAIVDWIAALALRDYVVRRFAPPSDAAQAACEERANALRQALVDYLQRGCAALTLTLGETGPALALSLRGWLERDFFRRAARHLRKLLKNTPATVTLRIEALRGAERRHLSRLLARLRHYGDRVSIVLDESLRDAIAIDSSVFNLIVLPSAAH